MVPKWTLPDLAAALATLSTEDRAYVERMSNDFAPRRRRRRRKNAAKKTAAKKASARSSKKKGSTKRANDGNGKSRETVADATLMRRSRGAQAEQ